MHKHYCRRGCPSCHSLCLLRLYISLHIYILYLYIWVCPPWEIILLCLWSGKPHSASLQFSGFRFQWATQRVVSNCGSVPVCCRVDCFQVWSLQQSLALLLSQGGRQEFILLLADLSQLLPGLFQFSLLLQHFLLSCYNLWTNINHFCYRNFLHRQSQRK